MHRHKGSWRRHSLGDAPQRETESTLDHVLRHYSTSLRSGAGRLARLFLVGCLLAILIGGVPLLRPSAVHAVQAAHTRGWATPLSSRNHDWDCSVVMFNCEEQQQECVPIVKVVKVVQVVPVEKKVFVAVPVVKVVKVFGPVEKVVKVFVPVQTVVMPTPTPTPMVDPSLNPMPPGDPMF